MTKASLVLVCFIMLGCSKICSAQQLLSKNEIYNDWIKSHHAPVNCDTVIDQLSYDAWSEAKIKSSIQSLVARGVDTLLVLVNSHPGTLFADSCMGTNYPEEVYIFWRASGKDSLMQNPNKCGLANAALASFPIFDFYSQYQHQLEKEYILPVIESATKEGNGIIYHRIISSDIDKFDLYYSVHGKCKRFAFSQADISNKSNLFYSDNTNSQVYKWFVNLQKECRKLQKK